MLMFYAMLTLLSREYHSFPKFTRSLFFKRLEFAFCRIGVSRNRGWEFFLRTIQAIFRSFKADSYFGIPAAPGPLKLFGIRYIQDSLFRQGFYA